MGLPIRPMEDFRKEFMSDQLTTQQLENWRKIYPEMRLWTNEMIQGFRNRLQSGLDAHRDTPAWRRGTKVTGTIGKR